MEGLALFQILPSLFFMVDLATFNKTWDCFAGPWPDAVLALTLKPLRRESADAELREHGSSLGTSIPLPTEGTAGRLRRVNHQLLVREKVVTVEIAVLSLISQIFLFVSSTLPPPLNSESERVLLELPQQNGKVQTYWFLIMLNFFIPP